MKFLPAIIIFMALVAFMLLVLVLVLGGKFISDEQAAIIGGLIGAVIGAATLYLTVEIQLKHQMKTAALERRLEAHQQAYALWRKLIFANDQNRDQIVRDCQNWWENNCLYLSAAPREAFWKACNSAPHYASSIKQHADSKLIKEFYKDVMTAGPLILEAVDLPPIMDQEGRSM